MRIALSPSTHFRGYAPLGANTTNDARDWHEGIDLYREGQVRSLTLPPALLALILLAWCARQ